jgi:hypothetical protein
MSRRLKRDRSLNCTHVLPVFAAPFLDEGICDDQNYEKN